MNKQPKIPTTYHTSEDVEVFVAQFRDCTLPCERWTHHAHLTVGLWYVLHYTPDEALNLLRDAIRAYNTTCGVPNSTTRGYHETITRFYVWLTDQFLQTTDRSRPLLELRNALVEQVGSSELPMQWWSRERLWSPEARAAWLEPDLKALDSRQ
ncbi:MAG: hypothetical protein KIH69_007615 [Anaerolineae bacterium]|nr:hypothetical protein [Anaerolineae bacterium]